MTKIAVFGDAHLGFKQYNMPERVLDFLTALANIFKAVIDEKVSAVISAGDLFNNARPDAEVVYRTQRIFNMFSGAKLGVDGNHDISDTHWLKVCGSESLAGCKSYRIENTNKPAIELVGMNWVRPNMFLEQLDIKLASLVGKKFDIFVCHQLFDEFISFKQDQLSAAAVATKLKPFGVKVVCIGDLHESVGKVIDGISFVYTGSIEVNSTAEARDKSFIVLDIDDNKNISVRRVPIATRKFVHRFIQTDSELDNLVIESANLTDSILMLEYDKGNKEIVKRAEKLLKDKALFRLVPRADKVVKPLIEQLSTDGFARAGAMTYLKKSIETFFEPATDEYQLITQLIAPEANIDSIVMTYAKSKGIV